MARWTRGWRWGAAVSLCWLGAALPVAAVEKRAAVFLPDAGLGSEAVDIAAGAPGHWAAAGYRHLPDGSTGPTLWRITVDPSDPSGNTYVFGTQPLSKPAGSQARATGVTAFPHPTDGSRSLVAACGVYSANGGVWKAALWREEPAGRFTRIPLDPLPSHANAIGLRRDGSGVVTVCGSYQPTTGGERACLWNIGPKGVKRVDLGTLDGARGAATDLAWSDELSGWAVIGNAESAEGRSGARLMEEEGIFYFIRALPVPDGSSSRAERIKLHPSGDVLITGEVAGRDGRTSGALWDHCFELPHATRLAVLPRLGQANTTARGVSVYGQGGNDLLITGAAWTNGSERTGAVWTVKRNTFTCIPAALPLLTANQDIEVENDETHWVGYDRTETVDLNETITIHGAHDRVMVGTGRYRGSGPLRALVWLPAPVEAPDSVLLRAGVSVGATQEGTAGSATSLWGKDWKTLRLAPVQNGDTQRIVIDFTGAGLTGSTRERKPTRVNLTARLAPSTPGKVFTWTVLLQLRDPATGQWVSLDRGSLSSVGGFQALSLPVADPDRFAATGEGSILGRLVVRGASEDDGVLAVDLLEVETE